MTPEQAAAEDAVHRVRAEIERLTGKPLPLPPQVVTALGSMILGAVALAGGAAIRAAELAGLERAGKVTDVASAEAAAQERTR